MKQSCGIKQYLSNEAGVAFPIFLFILLFLSFLALHTLTMLGDQQGMLQLQWEGIRDRYAAEGMIAWAEQYIFYEETVEQPIVQEINGREAKLVMFFSDEGMNCFRAVASGGGSRRQLVESCFTLPTKDMIIWREYETGMFEGNR